MASTHYCELHFTGREFSVFIHRTLIKALQREILRTAISPETSKSSGLLLGRGNEGAAIIFSYAPQLSRKLVEDKDQFWKQFGSSLKGRAGQFEILGYYRIMPGAEPVPDERDLRVLREFLPESASTLLLIGKSQEGNAGSVFVWGETNRERLLASQIKIQFPDPPSAEAKSGDYAAPGKHNFQSRENTERIQPEKSPAAPKGRGKFRDIRIQAQGLAAAGKRSLKSLPRAVQSAWRSPLVWVLAICIAAVPSWRLISTRQSRPKSSQKSSVQGTPKPLALAAKVEDGRLRVKWDPASPLLASARSAVLSVNPESGMPESQVLDRNQLMAGSQIFQLPSGRAKIRLLVFAEEVSELVPKSAPALVSESPAPGATISKPDSMIVLKENLPLPKAKTKAGSFRTSVVSSRLRNCTKSEKGDLERMTVGFTEEGWRSWLSPSPDRVPPRPIRLVQPDRYYSLHPFTLDSVRINIRISISSLGAVTSAESLVTGNALLSHLSDIAIRSARESTFAPAQVGDRNVPSTAILSFNFLRRK